MRYCGREFTPEELDWISRTSLETPEITRQELSIRFCEETGWLKPDGGLKDMSCRVAMLRMERDGLVRLPVAKGKHYKPRGYVKRTPLGEARPELRKAAGAFELELELVDSKSSALWNELIDRYHYLGYAPLPGAQLRYFVREGRELLALLGFSAAAWSTAPRDRFIGWESSVRKERLRFVVNNSRFLLLPWIHSKCLASRLLAMATRRLSDDWQKRYNYRPVLVETFVEKDRFAGTSYKAANWICVGETKGRGKWDRKHEKFVPVKTVWLYPLEKNFRNRLTG